MSSKSKARLPAEPLISIRMAFLRPLAKRVASNTPMRSALELGEEGRAVVDGHLPRAGPRGAGQPGVLAGQRALLDERLNRPETGRCCRR